MALMPSDSCLQRIAIISVHGCPVARLGERDTGGMNVYVLQTAKELGRRGIQVDVYTRAHDPRDEQVTELGPNARVIHLKAGPYRAGKGSLSRYLPLFIARLLEYQKAQGLSYQLVHSHYWLSGLVGCDLAQRWGIPLVSNFHTLAELKLQARVGEHEPLERLSGEQKVAETADVVVALTHHEQEALQRLYPDASGRVATIPGGVDAELFQPMDSAAAKAQFGLVGKRVILFVGRVEPLKGVDLLLRAVAQLDERQDLQVLIVGGRPEEDREIARLRALATELQIAPQVQFLGTVRHEELPAYYNAAEVCVLPSYYESFGLAALEAQACGVPVIASRVGGLPTVVHDNETGYLIPWRCPEPFSEHLEVLLRNEQLRQSLGRAARQHAVALSWKAVVDQLEELYCSLANGTLAAAAPRAGA